MTRRVPTTTVLKRSHDQYIDWLFGGGSDAGLGYQRDWIRHSPRFVFWYAVAGVPRGGETLAWKWLSWVDSGGYARLPAPRRRNWREAEELAHDIYRWTGKALVPWLADLKEHATLGWLKLQEIHLIGPKVSAWIMRDISFLADYAIQIKGTQFVYRRGRDRRWFTLLPATVQACFVPVDAWVYTYARRVGALTSALRRRSLSEIQGDPELHLKAASDIVRFARRRGLDLRDLDSYWYRLGAEYIDKDGREISS
jgi:hypothetical protein